MPGIRRQVTVAPGGPSRDAELVEVQQSSEQWNQYLLGDGSVVRMKTVVTEVWRLIDEYDQEGNPVYLVRSRNVLAVTTPDEMRKQKE